LPAWMQDIVRELLGTDHDHPFTSGHNRRARTPAKPTAKKIAASRIS
jgi:hypothetical protein